MLRPCALLTATLMAPMLALSQAPAQPRPKIQVNFLNPCHPAAAEAEEMTRALERVRERPRFSADFEISRGITTLTEAEARATGVRPDSGPSAWVRIRHEFSDKAPLSDAQYSLSVDDGSASEALALHLRDSRQVLEILISDAVAGRASQAVAVNTPPDRVRVERFGKSSLVLARCAGIDQSAYESIFATAGDILEKSRPAMAVKTIVPAELAHLPGGREPAGKGSRSREADGKSSRAAGANH